MELICLGDSLTFGYGVRMPKRWTTLTAKATGWKVNNQGISGDTSSGMLVRLRTGILADPAMGSFRPDRPQVMIMGGCNDIFYSGSDICARVNMGAMIQQLLAIGISPIIGIPMGIGNAGFPEAWNSLVDFSTVGERIEAYCDWLQAYCKAFGVRCVDFRGCFRNADGTTAEELFLDGLHPSEEGHARMAQQLSAFLLSDEGIR